jgi:hypothetical protein
MYKHCWVISSPAPYLFPHPLRFQAEPVLSFSPILLKSRHKQERQSVFASWDKDSYTERFLALVPCTSVLQPELIHLYLTFFTTSQSLSHIDLCRFKVTVLAPLQWGHQTLSSFGFPTFPYSSCMCSPLSIWLMSNNITAFVLDLKSAYEGERFLALWAWLTSLKMMFSSSIHCSCFFDGNKSLRIVYILFCCIILWSWW